MTRLQGACVLVTGATGGFGREMIRQFHAAGSRLVLTDLDLEALEAAASEMATSTAGEVAALVAADLSTREGCETLHAEVEASGLEVDVLVNNAGLAQFGYFHEIPLDSWEAVMRVNLLAPMHLARLFVPGMVERRRGHVVNIASIAGWVGAPGIAPYNASKFGLRGFGEALRVELEEYGVRVTTVCPFFSRTPILDSPSYGTLERPGPPEDLTTDPADVIRAVVDGVHRGRPDIFPDPTSRRMQWVARFAPGLLPWLRRRMTVRP